MNSGEERSPDAYLALLKEEEREAGKGRLKIFFGAVAGVGKTFAMLQTARRLKNDGMDVVIGYVETHGRKETAALLEGLEQLPRKKLQYKETEQHEFDLDLALKRHPQLILVDELAHNNVQGSRHKKRWQDVEELLDAGIDVFTTLNVQHVESLHDLVDHITGVPVQERVPDSIIERAVDIELVDLPPDELIARLKEGKVYVHDRALHALDNFFRKGNLIALRELALRLTADRVEAQMQQYRLSRHISEPWPTAEKLLVCVGPSPLSPTVVRAARRMANGLRAKWIAAYVQTPKSAYISEKDKSRVVQTLRLAEQLGAQTRELTGRSVSEEIVKCAQQNNVSKIVIGKPARPRWKELVSGSVVDELIRNSGIIDVYVITGEPDSAHAPFFRVPKPRTRFSAYLKAFATVTVCTVLARLMLPYFELSNIVMAYILGIVITATQYGRGPSVMASIVSVAAFDFFFVPPYLTFAVSDTQYVITFAVMLTVALVISTLTTRVKQQAETAREREQRTYALYSISRELSSMMDLEDIVEKSLSHIADVFQGQTALYLLNEHNELSLFARGIGKNALWAVDQGVALWSFKNKKPAGAGTDTLPAAAAIYVPLLGYKKVIGVLALGIEEKDRESVSPERLHLLETFASQIAVTCERAALTKENEKARLQMRTEQMKNTLLSSVSHDLRTPLATISGAACTLSDKNSKLSEREKHTLAKEICDQSLRLNKQVSNLLAVTKVEAPELALTKENCPVEELIGAALSALDEPLQEERLKVDIDDPSAEVFIDEALMQQALVNILDNALKHTQPNSEIKISVKTTAQEVIISIADDGPGIQDKDKNRIFEKFQRGNTSNSEGTGLGLAICKGIVQAHGGKVWVEDGPCGGSVFKILLQRATNGNYQVA